MSTVAIAWVRYRYIPVQPPSSFITVSPSIDINYLYSSTVLVGTEFIIRRLGITLRLPEYAVLSTESTYIRLVYLD